jgi:hypothetical protein
MLASNIGLTMNTHFCGGHAMKSTVSVGASQLDCGMGTMDQIEIRSQPVVSSYTPEPCCKNDHQEIQVDKKATCQKASVELNQTFLVAIIHTFIQPLIFIARVDVNHPNYSPPPLTRDIAVLIQTFLI